MTRPLLVSFACSLLLSTTAIAQVSQQAMLPLWGARNVADIAAAEAQKRKAGGEIAVVDGGGHLLFLQRLDNTFPAAATVAIEKDRTAALFRRPTRDFEKAIAGGRAALLGLQVMTPLQGGVPLLVDGQVMGAIGVSGATSAQEDDDIASAAASAFVVPSSTRR